MTMINKQWLQESILSFITLRHLKKFQELKTVSMSGTDHLQRILPIKKSNSNSNNFANHPMSIEEERKANTAKTINGVSSIHLNYGSRSLNTDASGTLKILMTTELSSLATN